MQNATKRLYCSKEVDQKCKTRQSVYIIPKKWTKLFSWVIFSRKIDALSGVHLPHLRLRFVGIARYASSKFAAYAARKSRSKKGYAIMKKQVE